MTEGVANTTAGHNVGNRLAIFKEIKTKIDAIGHKIAALQEDRKSLKGRIKADLGMKVVDFNMACRFIDLDGDERNELIDVIYEGMTAFGLPWPGTEDERQEKAEAEQEDAA